MMWINRKGLAALLLLALTACEQDKIDKIEGFDQNAWLNDQRGCKNTRREMAQFLYDHQDQFVGKEIEALIHFLGPAEKTNYLGRQKYFYHYYIETGKQCGDSLSTDGDQLVVEAEAMGRIRNLRFENGI